jgi:hypothetical protein
MLHANAVAHHNPWPSACFIVKSRLNNDAPNGRPAHDPNIYGAFEPPLVQGADDIAPELQGPQLDLHLAVEPVAAPGTCGEPQGLQMPQPSPRQGRPGLVHSHPVLDQTFGIGSGKKPPIEAREPVRLGLLPHAPLGLDACQVAEPFLGDFLGPGAETVADVVARDDEVPAVLAAAPDEDMGMRLAGVVVTGREPSQAGLAASAGTESGLFWLRASRACLLPHGAGAFSARNSAH